MKTPDVVKTSPRLVVRFRVTEQTPTIRQTQPKLSDEARKHLLDALGLADSAAVIAGELGEAFEGIAKGSACARYFGSEGYVLHVVMSEPMRGVSPELTPEALAEQLGEVEEPDQADEPPLPQRDLDGSVDDADTRALTDGTTDPDDEAELHERNVHLEAERDQLRRELAGLKVEHERLKTEKAEVVKALNERIAKDRAASIPPPKVATAKPTKPATPKAIETAKTKLNAKHGKGAGRTSKK